MRKLGTAIIASALGLSMFLAATPSHAVHSWVNHHWPRTANPRTLTYKTTFASTSALNTTWASLTATVIGQWDNVRQYKPTGTIDAFTFQSGNAANITIASKNYGATGWFGVATIQRNILTGHIASGEVKVNDYYFKGAYANNVARQHVMCQEVGHILGLEHNKLPVLYGASCMNDDNATLNNSAYKTPNAHDADQLTTIYTHTDSSNSAGALLETVVVDIIPA